MTHAVPSFGGTPPSQFAGSDQSELVVLLPVQNQIPFWARAGADQTNIEITAAATKSAIRRDVRDMRPSPVGRELKVAASDSCVNCENMMNLTVAGKKT